MHEKCPRKNTAVPGTVPAKRPQKRRGFFFPFTIVMGVDWWPMPGHKREPLIQRKGCGDREEASSFLTKHNSYKVMPAKNPKSELLV